MDGFNKISGKQGIDQEIFYNVDFNPSYRLDTGIYIYIYLPVYGRCTC